MIGEYTAWTGPFVSYTHGPGTDEPLIRSTEAASQYYHQDGLGSIVALTSASGATDASQRFDAWGNRLTGSGTIPNYGYTGREPDETGLVNYRARYYDPSIGRFIQRDPIGIAGGMNLYAYVNGNPVNFTDPNGLQAFDNTYTNTANWQKSYYGPTLLAGCGAECGSASDAGWKSTSTLALAGPIVVSGISGSGAGSSSGGGTFSSDGISYNAQGSPIGEVGLDSEPLIDPLMLIGGWSRQVGNVGQIGISGFTKHGINQVIERGIKPHNILDTLKNPLKVKNVVFDQFGRPSQRIIGHKAEIVINPVTREVISINPTATKKAERLSRGNK